jgi:outer membrane phospholipase A
VKEESPAPVAETAPMSVPASTEKQPAPPPTDKSVGNAFLANLSAYQPIYAVYGPGTNTDARIQISFKYKLFGSSSEDHGPADWRQGLHFAYTQRMFWDLGASSSPFRNIDYQPELIYISPRPCSTTAWLWPRRGPAP